MHSVSVRRGPRLSFDGAKVQYRTDTRSQSCQKNAKNALFYRNGSVLGEFGLCWSQKRALIVRKQQKDHKKEWPTMVALAKIVIDRVTSYKATDGYARSVGESL